MSSSLTGTGAVTGIGIELKGPKSSSRDEISVIGCGVGSSVGTGIVIAEVVEPRSKSIRESKISSELFTCGCTEGGEDIRAGISLLDICLG